MVTEKTCIYSCLSCQVPETLIKVPETVCQTVKIFLSCVATPASRRRIQSPLILYFLKIHEGGKVMTF